jgi:hypothetical protein
MALGTRMAQPVNQPRSLVPQTRGKSLGTRLPVNRHTLGARRGKYKGNSTFRAKALRLGVNSRQTSRRRTNFAAKELRSKRRISPCIFQIHHYQPFCYIRVTISELPSSANVASTIVKYRT